MLNDFVRIGEESRINRGDRPDHRRADRDQRARPGGDRGGARAVRRQARSTSRRARSMCVFAGCLPRGVEPDLYARLIRELREPRRHRDPRHRGRAAARRAARRARRRHPERARGRGARRPRVRRRRGLAAGLARDGRAGRRRGDHDPRPTAASRVVGEGGERALLRGRRPSRSSRSRPSAPATPSWPATSPPATTAARRGVPAPRGRLRRRVDPALRRRRDRPARGRAAAPGVEIKTLEVPARSS